LLSPKVTKSELVLRQGALVALVDISDKCASGAAIPLDIPLLPFFIGFTLHVISPLSPLY